ncbi:MAG: hypothetical protein ACOYK8_07635 [Alphaproteobacteria bacterium]
MSTNVHGCHAAQSIFNCSMNGLQRDMPNALIIASGIYPEPVSICSIRSWGKNPYSILKQENAAELALQNLFFEDLYEAGKIGGAPIPLLVPSTKNISDSLRYPSSLIDVIDGKRCFDVEAIDFVLKNFTNHDLWNEFYSNALYESSDETIHYFQQAFREIMKKDYSFDEKLSALHEVYMDNFNRTGDDPARIKRKIDDIEFFKNRAITEIKDYSALLEKSISAIEMPDLDGLINVINSKKWIASVRPDKFNQPLMDSLHQAVSLLKGDVDQWLENNLYDRSKRDCNASLQSVMIGLGLQNVKYSGLVVAVAMVQDVLDQGHSLSEIFPAFAASVGQGADKPKASVKPSHFAKPLKRGL